MTASKLQRKSLIQKLSVTGGNDIPIIGFMTWWSIKRVDLTKDKFEAFLKDCDLDPKWAREHNYRSAFSRALKSLEEQRIIRPVMEDGFKLIVQFTAERLVQEDGQGYLNYDRETLIEINKIKYQQDKKLENAISGKKEICEALVKLFYQEKTRYKSSDISRYIQNIFRMETDIVPLRQQGCLYFVPSDSEPLLKKVSNLIGKIVKGDDEAFEFVPLPDVGSSRLLVGKAVNGETKASYEKIAEEIEKALESEDEVTEIWKNTRITRIRELQERLVRYEELLGEGGKVLVKKAESLEKQILKFRKLDLGD